MRLIFCLFLGWSWSVSAQTIDLSPSLLDTFNVRVTTTTYKGKNSLHLTGTNYNNTELAVYKDLAFLNGIIEMDVSGSPIPGTDTSFRGFIGIAFRIKKKNDTLYYECIYLRPTNARSDNQLQRNHTTQYISAPHYPWQRLRKETPGFYESYVDMVAGEWTHIKIEVKEKHAKLFINRATQPCLVINDLKNEVTQGSIGLWIGPGTDGYFTNLQVKSPD